MTAGAMNRESSSRLWRSGVTIIAISTRWFPSPVTRPANSPAIIARPSSVSPSSVKNAMASSRDSTTMPTLSMRLTVKSSPCHSWLILLRDERDHVPCKATRLVEVDEMPGALVHDELRVLQRLRETPLRLDTDGSVLAAGDDEHRHGQALRRVESI